MLFMGLRVFWTLLAGGLLAVAAVQASPLTLVDEAVGALDPSPQAAPSPEELGIPEQVEQFLPDDEGGEAAPPPEQGDDEGIGARLRDALGGGLMMAGAAALAAAALGMAGFALVTRYISPKEALKNPQRAMLYGFVKATPGAHLKQLSEEFNMKTSSILWHIRKLESADLVRSERANGFRVFYAVKGGIEVKRLSRAITALQNDNARQIYGLVDRKAGQSVKELSTRLSVHAGTVRWHVRKLREFGLIEELVRDDGSLFYGTPLGRKALEATEGSPTTPTHNTVKVPHVHLAEA